jgi:hypothetical protein
MFFIIYYMNKLGTLIFKHYILILASHLEKNLPTFLNEKSPIYNLTQEFWILHSPMLKFIQNSLSETV